jgi:hypothetical protein
MNPKKKSRRCRGLGLDSGLDLAISRFINSFAHKAINNPLNAAESYKLAACQFFQFCKQ